MTTATLGASAGDGFGVFGYYTAATSTTAAVFAEASSTPNFMYNTNVKGDGNTSIAWSYSPLKYWPNNTKDAVSFFAYAPYNAYNATAGTNGITFEAVSAMEGVPVLTYTIGTTGAATADFVVAAPSYNNYNTTTYSTGQSYINFTFKHVLTRVAFNAVLELNANGAANGSNLETATKVYITDMQIVADANTDLIDKTGAKPSVSTGLYASADFTYMASGATAADEDIEGVGIWGNFTAISSADLALSGLLNTTYNAYASGVAKNGVSITQTSASIFNEDEYLYLIPNGDTGIASGSAVYVYVEYDVVTTDVTLPNGVSVITNKDVVTLPTGTLVAGVAYTYTLTVGLDEVKLSATVQDDSWTIATGSVVTPEAD